MRDYFGEVIAVLLVVVALFAAPIVYFGIKQDSVTQSFVYTKVTDFVENVQENGYISQDMYNDFTRQIGTTDLVYDVAMEHVHPVAMPLFNDTGNAVVATTTFDSSRYEDEILAGIYDSKGLYYMKTGDYFSITVTNRTRTLGQQVSRLLLNTSTKHAVAVTYGGRIRNENY